MSFVKRLAAISVATLIAPSLHAAVITLDFEGLRNFESVNDFYNGGTGSDGSSGEDFGIEFSENSLATIDEDAGGTGNFGNEPTPDTTLFFLSGTAATLNFAEGFDTGFSFFYSAINQSGSIDVYDELNGTGNLLASLFLPTTPSQTGDPTGEFNVFESIGVAFDGIAKSIDFGGVIDQIGFDNITFGSVTPGDTGGVEDTPTVLPPVPLPASLPLLLAGLAGLGFLRRRGR